MIVIRAATENDAAALQALQARCPQGASLVISTVNAPDFFGRARIYAERAVLVAEDGGRIVGSAACAVRPALVDGAIRPVGYEFQYFVDPDQRQRGIARMLREAVEEYLRAHNAVLSYAAIVEGNTPSLNLFTRQGFHVHRTLTMYGLLVYRQHELPSTYSVRSATAADLDAIARLCNQTWAGRELYLPFNAASLAEFIERTPAYSLDNLLVAEQDGALVACAGYWDWGAITKVTVKAFNQRLRRLATLLRWGGKLFTLPQLPSVGSELRQWIVTPLGMRSPQATNTLLREINNRALSQNIDFVFASADRPHPLSASLKGLFHADTQLSIVVKYFDDARLRPGPIALGGEDA